MNNTVVICVCNPISYSIVGGNEHRVFSIDPKRGVIAVSNKGGVDHERQVRVSKDFLVKIVKISKL